MCMCVSLHVVCVCVCVRLGTSVSFWLMCLCVCFWPQRVCDYRWALATIPVCCLLKGRLLLLSSGFMTEKCFVWPEDTFSHHVLIKYRWDYWKIMYPKHNILFWPPTTNSRLLFLYCSYYSLDNMVFGIYLTPFYYNLQAESDQMCSLQCWLPTLKIVMESDDDCNTDSKWNTRLTFRQVCLGTAWWMCVRHRYEVCEVSVTCVMCVTCVRTVSMFVCLYFKYTFLMNSSYLS